MAPANRQHKPKPAKRTSRRRTSQQSGRGSLPPNCRPIEDVFFRQWRDLFGSERALQHLEDLLRSRPSWHSARGKVTFLDVDLGFWQRVTLSVKINAKGVDCLKVNYARPYVHEPDYSYFLRDGRFFLRTVDVIEREERLTRGNNVISDYDLIEEFEREREGRPRTPPRLYPVAAPQTAPERQPEPGADSDPPRTEPGRSPADPPKDDSSKRKVPKTWVVDEAIRLKKANEIPSDARRRPTAFAKLLAKRMKDAPEADKPTRLVGWQHIKNQLPKWGLWPVESIKIS
jgi:hypothetical protein